MAIVVDQKHLGGGSHSTVGTITDIYSLLRLLYSRAGRPQVGSRLVFSFNDPQGMCPECNGDRAQDRRGPVRLPGYFQIAQRGLDSVSGVRRGRLGLGHLPPVWLVRHGQDTLGVHRGGDGPPPARQGAEGPDQFGGKSVNIPTKASSTNSAGNTSRETANAYSERTRKSGGAVHDLRPLHAVQRREAQPTGPEFQDRRPHHRGTRGHGSRRTDRYHPGDPGPGRGVPSSRPCSAPFGHDRHRPRIPQLDRETDTLSGGESQRVKMVKHLNSSLVDMMYVFDEPSIGMHPRDVHRLDELLVKLRD